MNSLLSLTATLLVAAQLPAGKEAPRPVDFDTDVLPVFTKAGCNTGACHGSAAGRGGFKLSLWGSDPAADHLEIVKELEGRRINPTKPEASLLLLKPTGQIKHGGGRRLTKDESDTALVLTWLRDGAARPGKRQLQDFEVTPARRVLTKTDESLTLKGTARFNDGSTADVTPWCVFTPDDPAAVEVGAAGKVTVLRRGQATMMVRYLDRVVAVRLVVPVGEKAVDFSKEERRNFIDEEVLAALETLRLPVAPQTDDAAFLRRLRLDLTGTLPTPEEIRDFAADKRKDKRSRLIDRLLDSAEFVDYRTLQWATLLQINSRSLGQEGAKTYATWLRERVAKNTPLDEVARALLTGEGDSYRVGPANFTRISPNARDQAEHVSRVFMGVRLQCANCHNHPLDRWTQDDYHGLSAVFAKLERGREVKLGPRGEVIHPRTGEPATPRLPGARFLDAKADGRDELARWVSGRDNPYFARSVVNRLWKDMMGRGLVDPPDDLRESNPASHPALLDKLARDFAEHGFDTRHTLRLIANSAAYQRSAQATDANRSDDRFYSHALVRPLRAEVLADALANATGVGDKYGDLPQGTRAVTLHDSLVPAPSLDILGRCSRLDPCDDSKASAGGLAQTLHLINGPLLNKKITAPEGRLHQLLAGKKTDGEIVEELYLRALGRPPSEKEVAHWGKTVRDALGADERREVFEDFLWGLLTSKEFKTNH